MRDHSPITLDKFNGLWDRGDIEDVPLDHLSEANNLQSYGVGGFVTRDGLGRHQDVAAPLANILRMYNYPTSERQTLLVLTEGGNIYHVIDETTIYGPILTIAGMTDFAFIPYSGRAYITPFTTEVSGDLNRERGLQNQFLYVYKGDGTAARKAAGSNPTTNVTVVDGIAGYTDAGIHIFGYVFETDTGYLSAPGGLVAFETEALKSVSFSTVAASPDGFATKRHLVASKVIQVASYNGDVNGYQLYFIPEATIPNNSGTTLSNISFYDSDLIEDASHLSDNFEEIPAGCNLFVYHNRLCLVGEYDNPSGVVRVSEPGEPEAINQVDGLCQVTPDGNYLTNGAELRDVMYVFRRAKTVSFVDNGDVPSSWPLSNVDNAMGCGVHGIAAVIDSGSANVDFLIVASYNGLILFNGRYILPELSWKIQNFWKQQNLKQKSRFIQLINDSVGNKLYCVLTDKNLLVGDYANGLDPKSIKWWPWDFDVNVNSVCFININELILGCDQSVT